MKDLFKNLQADKTIFRFNIFTFLIILLTIIFIIVNYRDLPPLIPLFNQLPWGPKRLGETFAIFIPSFIVIIIYVVNIFISTFIYKKTPLIARILSITSFLIALLTLLFIFRTIQIVL